MICYLDASALVKRYIAEPGSDIVDRAMAESEGTGTATISRAEVAAAFAKAVRVGALEKEEGSLCFSHFRDEWPDFLRLQITEATTERAASMAWDFGLRGYDAVHLAAAAIWQEALATSITFASFDLNLWRAAMRVGLLTSPADLPTLLDRWKERSLPP